MKGIPFFLITAALLALSGATAFGYWSDRLDVKVSVPVWHDVDISRIPAEKPPGDQEAAPPAAQAEPRRSDGASGPDEDAAEQVPLPESLPGGQLTVPEQEAADGIAEPAAP